MIKPNRFIRTILGFVLLIGFGYPLFSVLSQVCITSPQSECILMWGVTLSAIIGGFIGTEMWFQKKIREGKPTKDKEDESLDLVTWGLLRSTLQAIGFIILSALPIIVVGSISVAGFGVLCGLSLSIITRGLTNRFPPA